MRRDADSWGTYEVWDHLQQRAYALLTSPAGIAALDLSAKARPHAQRTVKRRSVRAACWVGGSWRPACPYVQVNWSRFVEVFYPFSDYGWDTHADNFGLIADWHAPLLDGCFRRSSTTWKIAGCSRPRWSSAWVSSAGPRASTRSARATTGTPVIFRSGPAAAFKPGRTIGESDARGEHPVSDPITPAMVGATILELAGINSATRAELRMLPEGRVVHELL